MPARCFVAFDLPADAHVLLERAQDVFLDAEPSWMHEKWVRRDLRHVTVRFIGRVDDADLPRIEDGLRVAAARGGPFTLELAGVHAVPSVRRARMLWGTFAERPCELAALASSIDELLEEGFGVEREDREYSPHVTLVRARTPREASSAALEAARSTVTEAPLEHRRVPVDEIVLYSSTLTRQGPEYRALAAITLGCTG